MGGGVSTEGERRLGVHSLTRGPGAAVEAGPVIGALKLPFSTDEKVVCANRSCKLDLENSWAAKTLAGLGLNQTPFGMGDQLVK